MDDDECRNELSKAKSKLSSAEKVKAICGSIFASAFYGLLVAGLVALMMSLVTLPAACKFTYCEPVTNYAPTGECPPLEQQNINSVAAQSECSDYHRSFDPIEITSAVIAGCVVFTISMGVFVVYILKGKMP